MFQFFVFSAHFPYNQTEETNKRENTTSMLWLIGKIKKIKLQLKNTQRLWIFNFPKPFGPIQNRNLHSSSSLSIFILQPKQQRPKEFLPPLSFPSIFSGTKRQRIKRRKIETQERENANISYIFVVESLRFVEMRRGHLARHVSGVVYETLEPLHLIRQRQSPRNSDSRDGGQSAGKEL